MSAGSKAVMPAATAEPLWITNVLELLRGCITRGNLRHCPALTHGGSRLCIVRFCRCCCVTLIGNPHSQSDRGLLNS